MHLPHRELWQEILATPQLVRFTFPQQNGLSRYPTLVIKAHSLLLKYISQGVPLTLFFFSIPSGYCAYALHVADDPDNGVILWSLLTDVDEVEAIRDLAKHGGCSVYLFNEACANCAWTSATIEITSPILALADAPLFDDRNPIQHIDEVSAILDRIHLGIADDAVRVDIRSSNDWEPLRTDFILNGVRTATLNLLSDNEGTHQEQLAHALLGDLSPRGAYLNTQLHEPSGKKEYTDVLLTHEYGTVLLESKTLSIFEHRTQLPNRSKLLRNIEKSANKALNQLRVAVRKLRENVPVFDEHGEVIELEREQPPHAILLVPELTLMAPQNDEWFCRIDEFMRRTGGFLHLLDTVQLFRIMQAARMISEASNNVTPMMAFDYYLVEHAEAVAKQRSIDIDMMLRIQ
ncbi:hypothetical protein ACQKGL_21825 [Ensifer adhaerens]|uniref:hypothetical protein n=1 Tax=Ensifer adhaerens TaxID=106592 RepID=UPI003D090BF1